MSEEPTFVFRSMFESGIVDMLKGYTGKRVHALVLEAPSPPAVGTPGISI